MLSYFPEPYPDELWYSVLCRYYVRSGFQKQATIAEELYQSPTLFHGGLASSFPCIAVLDNLPEGLLDLEKVIMNHTLTPYYLRMMSQEIKRNYYDAVKQKAKLWPKNINPQAPDGREGLKFCPLCLKEDAERYGEPYWHREHQIPLMPLCPVHQCRLEYDDHKWNEIKRNFYPLCAVKAPVPDYRCQEWEPALTNILDQFLRLPVETGPTYGYSNLNDALIMAGCEVKVYKNRPSLTGEKLWERCVSFYGEEISRSCLNRASFLSLTAKLTNWYFSAPEFYALLAVFVGMTASKLFAPRIYCETDLVREQYTEKVNVLLTKSMKDQLVQIAEVSNLPVSICARNLLVDALQRCDDSQVNMV